MRLALIVLYNPSHPLGDRERSIILAPANFDEDGVFTDTSTAVPRLTGRDAVRSNEKIDSPWIRKESRGPSGVATLSPPVPGVVPEPAKGKDSMWPGVIIIKHSPGEIFSHWFVAHVKMNALNFEPILGTGGGGCCGGEATGVGGTAVASDAFSASAFSMAAELDEIEDGRC